MPHPCARVAGRDTLKSCSPARTNASTSLRRVACDPDPSGLQGIEQFAGVPGEPEEPVLLGYRLWGQPMLRAQAPG